jgi:EAL domain-containing protein (putative c-di-GMP-specific phosphodiesterase class I)
MIESPIPALSQPRPDVHRDNLLIYIGNQPDLFNAYREETVRPAVFDALTRGLGALGISTGRISFVISSIGEYVSVGLDEVPEDKEESDDLFLERVKAAVSRLPIKCGPGPHRAFMNVFATLGVAGQFREQLSTGVPDEPRPSRVGQTGPESESGKHAAHAAYRDDMATAADFFEKCRAGMIDLAFRPLVMADGEQAHIYNECLLQIAVADDGRPASCAEAVRALERLGLIDRLDRSVLWAVIETLEENPSIHLVSNISALSLRHDCWWRLLLDYLAQNPGVAERLTLKIAGMGAVSQSDEALNLLLSLRVMGCRIGSDDMGSGTGTADFLLKMRPSIFPGWLNKPVTVKDSFEHDHRCLSARSHGRAKEGM